MRDSSKHDQNEQITLRIPIGEADTDRPRSLQIEALGDRENSFEPQSVGAQSKPSWISFGARCNEVGDPRGNFARRKVMQVMEEERLAFAAVTVEEAGYVLVFNNSGDVLRPRCRSGKSRLNLVLNP